MEFYLSQAGTTGRNLKELTLVRSSTFCPPLPVFPGACLQAPDGVGVPVCLILVTKSCRGRKINSLSTLHSACLAETLFSGASHQWISSSSLKVLPCSYRNSRLSLVSLTCLVGLKNFIYLRPHSGHSSFVVGSSLTPVPVWFLSRT